MFRYNRDAYQPEGDRMLKILHRDDLFTLDLAKLNRPPQIPPLPLPNHPTDFVCVSTRRYKLRHPRIQPNGNAVSPVEKGTHAERLRNFLWLPWIPGKVSYTPLTPRLSVITGLMSGCWLVKFQLNGQLCFGHIGTDLGPYTTNSIAAKNAWTMAMGQRQITPVSAFNPIRHGPPAASVFGAISGNGTFYALGCSRISVPQGAMPYKVDDKTRVPNGQLKPTFI